MVNCTQKFRQFAFPATVAMTALLSACTGNEPYSGQPPSTSTASNIGCVNIPTLDDLNKSRARGREHPIYQRSNDEIRGFCVQVKDQFVTAGKLGQKAMSLAELSRQAPEGKLSHGEYHNNMSDAEETYGFAYQEQLRLSSQLTALGSVLSENKRTPDESGAACSFADVQEYKLENIAIRSYNF